MKIFMPISCYLRNIHCQSKVSEGNELLRHNSGNFIMLKLTFLGGVHEQFYCCVFPLLQCLHGHGEK